MKKPNKVQPIIVEHNIDVNIKTNIKAQVFWAILEAIAYILAISLFVIDILCGKWFFAFVFLVIVILLIFRNS